MSQLPTERQRNILLWLNDQKTLSIDDLASRLNVSVMTVHRDLNGMALAGQVAKVHGGVTLVQPETVMAHASPACTLCGMHTSERTSFIIQKGREQLYACCAHCGLLLLSEMELVSSALARDFIYGRMVNALKAVYLLESDIRLCCEPGALVFASTEDAQRVQQGFNGRVASFMEAQQFLCSQHGSGHMAHGHSA